MGSFKVHKQQVEKMLSLSYEQERLLTWLKLHPNTLSLSIPGAWELHGNLDLGAFEKALDLLAIKHESLRTSFKKSATGTFQRIVQPSLDVPLDIIDLQEEADTKIALEQAIRSFQRHTFLIDGGTPLFAVRLLQIQPDAYVFMVILHHLISDWWSLYLFFRDLMVIYSKLKTGNDAQIAIGEIRNFHPFIAKEKNRFAPAIIQRELLFWKEKIAGRQFYLPFDLNQYAWHQGNTSASISLHIPAQLSARIKNRCLALNLKPFTFFLAAIKLLLFALTEKEDNLVLVPDHNRADKAEFETIGLFATILTVINEIHNGEKLSRFFAAVENAITEAKEHILPIAAVTPLLLENEDAPERKRLQVVYSYMNAISSKDHIAGISTQQIETNRPATDFELFFLVLKHAKGQYYLILEYLETLFPKAYIQRLIQTLFEIIDLMLAEEEMNVSSVFQLPSLERKDKLVIVSTFTTAPLQKALNFWRFTLSCPYAISYAPYAQVFQEIIRLDSDFQTNKKGANCVLLRYEDWAGSDLDNDKIDWEETSKQIQRNINDLITVLREQMPRAPVILVACQEKPILANSEKWIAIRNQCDESLHHFSNQYPNIFFINAQEIQELYPVETYHYAEGLEQGHIPYTDDYYVALATALVRKYHSLKRAPVKVIMLDCDHTLWNGIVGEDGLEGIYIDASKKLLQSFILKQQQQGVLIALISKNQEKDVLDVLEHHPDMLIRKEHLTALKVNWEAKYRNISALADELNLGLDSFIFIDDNPIECQEVEQNCPGVIVLQMPQSREEVERLTKHIWAFDRGMITNEDLKKTAQYRENFERNAFKKTQKTLDAFIEGLELEIDIHFLTNEEVVRAAQLTQKTNQFNFTTIRRTQSEVQSLFESTSYNVWSVHLKDRFGDYGFVGLIIAKGEASVLRLDTFLLSCRALGRKVELEMLKQLFVTASANACSHLQIELIPTPRNEPARKFVAEAFGEYLVEDAFKLVYLVPVTVALHFEAKEEKISEPDKTESSQNESVTIGTEQHQTAIKEIFNKYYSVSLISAAITSGNPPKLIRKGKTDTNRAPQNEIESMLLGIWQDILQVDGLNVHDNFFELGGDSIKAIQILSQLKAKGFSFEIADFFEEPSISNLALKATAKDSSNTLLEKGLSHSVVSKFSINNRNHFLKKETLEQLKQRYQDISLVMPLSPMQEGIYFHWLQDKTSLTYFEQFSFRLKESANIPLIRVCFEELIARHQILRAIFFNDPGAGPLQIIRENGEAAIIQLNLAKEYPEVQQKAIEIYRSEERRRGFNLHEGALVRLGIIDCGKNGLELVWSFHHIIMDGWSLGMLNADLFNSYQVKAGNQKAVPAKVGFYSDYIEWLQGVEQEKAYTFWESYLEGFIGETSLPGNTLHGALEMQVCEERLSLPDTLLSALKRKSSAIGVTFNTMMQTAWGILLCKYNNTNDVVFGTVVSERFIGVDQIEHTLGLLINTIPVRVKYEASTSIAELAKENQKKWQEGITYHYSQLSEIQQRVNKGNTLINHILVFENFPIDTVLKSKIEISEIEIFGQNSFDLTIIFNPHGTSFDIIFKYNTNKYPNSQINRLKAHLLEILTIFSQQNLEKEKELSFILQEEREALVNMLNKSSVSFPNNKTVVDLFEEQVARTPQNTAIVFDGQPLSYCELNEHANRLAHYLRTEKKIQPNDLIGIQLDRNQWLVIAIIGVLKSGAAYVPIDPAYPKERIKLILNDSQCKEIINQDKLDSYIPELQSYPSENLPSLNSPNDLAYVIYTSGTSGQPKGSLIEHQQVVRLFFNEEPLFDFNDTDVWTLFHSFCFDFSVWEIFGALLFGGKLVIIPEGANQNPEAFMDLMIKEGVTVLNQTPSSFYNLSQVLDSRGYLPLKLRYIIFGGEALTPNKLKPWKLRYPATKLINMYGITETTVHVTYKEIGWEEINANVSNIGKPIPTLSCYVLDQRQQLVPIGIEGELYVGGKGVCRGYLNRPILNKERFLPNPFEPRDRLYRSGDLVKIMENGDLEYRGRIDHQVKIRGYRIELGEIENVLQSHEAIENCVLVAKAIQKDTPELIAYVVSNEELIVNDLRNFLLARLPNYMVPAYFVQLNALPLTFNGKINKKALPNPEGLFLSNKLAFVAPRTDTERNLIVLWKNLLSLEEIGVHDNFFDIGGHSLKIIRLLSAIQTTFSVSLKIGDIFSHPTIEQLAAFIDEQEQVSLQEIEPLIEQEDYVLSSAQSRMWVLDQLEEEQIAYNIFTAILLEGTLNTAALEKALQSLIQRHEILRTVFIDRNGEPRQKILSEWDLPLEYIDIEGAQNQDTLVQEMAQAHARHRFDLEKGPLMKMQLLQLGPSNNVLLVNMHHIISDGWSVAIMVKELNLLYNAFLHRQPNPLSPLRIQYKDYAKWQQDQLKSEDSITPIRSYWLQKLQAPLPHLELPNDRPRPSLKTSSGGSVQQEIPADTLYQLQQMANRNNCTLFVVFMALLKTLLYKYSGEEDLIVGTPIAGRNHPDLENQIGMYVNTIALRDQVKGDDSFNQLLEKVKQTILEAYKYGHYPFDQLVVELGLSRNLSRSPLFNVMLVLQNDGRSELELAGVKASLLPMDIVFSKFDIVFNLAPNGDKMDLRIEFNTDLFSHKRMERMGSHFLEIVKNVLKAPTSPIAAYDIVSPQERYQLLFEFNNTATNIPTDCTVIELFEKQVVCNPSKTAIIFNDRSMTYAQLNAIANQIAHLLRNQYHVHPDVRIGLLLDRSEWRMAAILGVLKAGGAYVPIDTLYPAERIAYMIKDSSIGVVLTTASEAAKINFNFDGKLVLLDSTILAAAPSHNLTPIARPGDLAYVLYTSGSTGQPKGVMIEHLGLVNMGLGLINKHGITKDDRVCQFAPYTFDVAVSEMLRSFLSGATMVMVDEETIASSEKFVSYIQEKGVTILTIPPTYLSALGCQEFSKLRVLSTGGESPHLNEIKFYSSRVRYFNSYGPTENTVCISNFEVDPTNLNQYERIPIGRPIANTEVYILDKGDHLVPIGMVGEICVHSPGLARGYQNNEKETARKFVDNPFKKGSRMYRTGDLGRWLEDGNIEFVGRMDSQVKIRGHRIELLEIEKTLKAFERINTCKVVSIKSKSGKKELAAYYTGEEKLSNENLRHYLSNRLPSYMVPSHFIQLEELPLTTNGKIDENALPAPEGIIRENGFHYQPPRNDLETQLVAIWTELLEVPDIGVLDNFFDLGGHSLKAMQVIARIRSQIDSRIQLKDLFIQPTISQLASLIQNLREGGGGETKTSPKKQTLDISESPGVEIIHQSLLPLVIIGALEGVDSVALGYASDSWPKIWGVSEEEFLQEFMDNMPMLSAITSTSWGRIGTIILPIFHAQLYDKKQTLETYILQALRMSKVLGARAVALTGLLPSATNYGLQLKQHLEKEKTLPPITTGHATTCASVILNIKKILTITGRTMQHEQVGFIGLGSIGANTLRLMLKVLPHPKRLLLCDLFSRSSELDDLKEEILNQYHFKGEIHLLKTHGGRLPNAIHEATVLVGATNTPEVIEIGQLQPGTIIIDDSGPHCFNTSEGIKRLEERHDILFTEGGALKLPEEIYQSLYIPARVRSLLSKDKLPIRGDEFTVMGCMLSGLLSTQFKEVEPTVGSFDIAVSEKQYHLLLDQGIEGADLHCDRYQVPPSIIDSFTQKHGNK